jgi:large subunit ribosomal protein L24
MSEGGRVKSPAAISVSNVMVVCPVCKRPTRTGIKTTEVKGDVRKVRVCRRADCGEEIDR